MTEFIAKIIYHLVCDECGLALQVINKSRMPLVYIHESPDEWMASGSLRASPCHCIGVRFMVVDGKVIPLSVISQGLIGLDGENDRIHPRKETPHSRQRHRWIS